MTTGSKDLLDRLDTMCKEVENITFRIGQVEQRTEIQTGFE